MAEFGSQHFTSHSGLKPSIFSILAQESLSTSLRDGFRHACKVLAENFPGHFLQFHLNFEEFYTLTDFIFNCIHLRIKGATFSEYFYDMKRIPDSRTASVSCKQVIFWALITSAFPYLRNRSENLFKKIREKEEEGSLADGVKKAAILYKRTYPLLHFTWEFLILWYYLAYALNKSKCHSPLLHLTSSKLQTLGQEDIIENPWEKKLLNYGKIPSLMWRLLKFAIETAAVSVSVGAFGLQFLDWWYSSEGRTMVLSPKPVPPPPPKWPCNIAAGTCPLCQKSLTNDTALRCSGFVFCYPCIFRHIEDTSCCPVTGFAASVDDLVRIYQQND